MPTLATLFGTILAIFGVLLLTRIITYGRRNAPLPPGPKGLPIIGNVQDMPRSHQWLTFADWSKKYGNIIYMNLFGQHLVILNSAEHAIALLDKRSNIYSDRPRLVVGGEMAGWRNTLALVPYGKRLRTYRKYVARFMGGERQVAGFAGLEEQETQNLLRRLLRDPDNVSENIRKLAGTIITKLVYGYDVVEGEDPLISLADNALRQFSIATAPNTLVFDVFPWLRFLPCWMPGAGFRKQAQEWKRTVEEMAQSPFEMVKQRTMVQGDTYNYVAKLLETESSDSDTEFNIKWSAASLYAGGADTSVSSIYSFVLAMTLFPDVQKCAQAEIDAVIGSERLPSLSDRRNLPYVEALMKEVLRWHCVTPLFGHKLMQDDHYEGYFLPKGSIIMVNAWNISHDPLVYPDPSRFDPSRFLPQDQKEIALDPYEYCFGFGRRICPGRYLADSSVFIACAMMLAVFDITKTIENGVTVEPIVEHTDGTISHPKPFKCSIKPRSANAEALIVADIDQAASTN